MCAYVYFLYKCLRIFTLSIDGECFILHKNLNVLTSGSHLFYSCALFGQKVIRFRV